MFLAHGTNCPILHIIIIIHNITIHIFLFRTANANLIVHFPLTPVSICFLQYIAGLKVLFYNQFASYSH